MALISHKDTKKYEALDRFVHNLHHINDEKFVYTFEELDRAMELSGLIADGLWGHLITTRRYIHEGIDVETLHGKGKLVFAPQDDGFIVRIVKTNGQNNK